MGTSLYNESEKVIDVKDVNTLEKHEHDEKYDAHHAGSVRSDYDEDSPIEEVKLVVSNTDDPTLPVYTFRMWFLGIIFSCLLSFINQFFWFRDNPLALSPIIIQLVSYPLGKFMAKVIPSSPFFNPGPFNIKEHVLITTMANCSYGTAYAVDVIVIQKLFYKQDLGWGGGILLIWTTQFIGYGMAGFLRPYLVYPANMVWPSNLSNISLFTSLHNENTEEKGISRLKWFLYTFCAMFVYYWLPGYFFQTLTAFSWVCWIKPDNIMLSQLTGGASGLGMLSLAFDWTTASAFLGSPLVVPWWVIVNIAVGFVIVAWLITPIMYYMNVWNAMNFPIISSALFYLNGDPWDNSLVLTPEATLNETAYAEYGPIYLTAFFAMTYGIMFAGLTAVLVHTALYHGKDIINQFTKSRDENDDIHRKLMRVYPEVPHWWYLSVFIISFGVSFAVIYCWPIGLPWWGLILAIAIPLIFVLPIGIIQAITNQQPGLNVITEFIIGYAFPGHPIACVVFKTYGYISMNQCLTFVGDLKLGHYTKIPPRAMFHVQLVGTFLAGILNLVTARWLMDTVKDICTKAAVPFTCPNATTFYSASIIWGAIGPQKIFGPGSPYSVLMWFFLIGAILPVPFYLLQKKYPKSWVRHVHIPLILNATGLMPPAMPLNFSSWIFFGFFFMFFLRKYYRNWWNKYNYVTSAAFDSGTAISAVVIFGVVLGSGYIPKWFGNGSIVPGVFDNCPLSGNNGFGQ
ncbi:OPT family small oligopeptide transporter [Spinellus fusiger]|nr:OPT family small oligopeptide transporter [Spinellus fusiger]